MTVKSLTTTEKQSGNITDLIRREIRQALLQTRCAIPGKVVSFDGTRAKVQPLFKAVLAPDTNPISLPEIVDVPVCFPVSNGGASYITVPIKAGDTVTLTFFDRDMAAWLYGDGSAKEPESMRIHDLTDASFTPDLTPFDKAIGASTDDLEIVNDNMSIILHDDGKIEIKGSSAEMVDVINNYLINNNAVGAQLSIFAKACKAGPTGLGAAATALELALGVAPPPPVPPTDLLLDLTQDQQNLQTLKKV